MTLKGQRLMAWSNNILFLTHCAIKNIHQISINMISLIYTNVTGAWWKIIIVFKLKSWASNLLCQGPLNHWAFFQLDPNRWLTITHMILPGDKNKHYELFFLLIYYYTLNFVLFARLECACFWDTHITVWNTKFSPLIQIPYIYIDTKKCPSPKCQHERFMYSCSLGE